MMLYAKIYGPYDGSNFYLFQFKFWIHFRLTKTESIKEVPNWHWRRFMNKLFLVTWGLKCFNINPLYELTRDYHVTGKFVLFVCKLFYRYLTTKIEFDEPELVNFAQTQGCNPSLIMIVAIRDPWTLNLGFDFYKQSCPCPQNSGGHTFRKHMCRCQMRTWSGSRKKNLLKSRNSIFENHKNGDHLDMLYWHTVVTQ